MRHLPKAQVQRLARARASLKRRQHRAWDLCLEALSSSVHVFRDPPRCEPLLIYNRVRPDGRTEYAIPGDPALPLDWFCTTDPKGK